MGEQKYIVTAEEAYKLHSITHYPEEWDSDVEDWLEEREFCERTCEDISAEYGKFVCDRCGCVVHDTSVIDNGGLYYCPDCGAGVVYG